MQSYENEPPIEPTVMDLAEQAAEDAEAVVGEAIPATGYTEDF